MSDTIRIATRQSPLALWQANMVRTRLLQLHPVLQVELLPMTTKGDRQQSTSLAKIGGKGLFIKELETALFDNSADLAVHSMKDVTAVMPDGLIISTLLERENPYDALVSSRYGSLGELPEDAVIGTCSPRRQAQILARFPKFRIKELRGNVGTRLSKLDAGEFDATLLACAGLERLEMPARIAQVLTNDVCLPAVTQGTIGIEVRQDDSRILQLLAPMDHMETRYRTTAERAFSATLNGGCSAPIAGFAEVEGSTVTLTGRVIALDGSKTLEARESAPVEQSHQLGVNMAEHLISKGATAILDAAQNGLQA